MNKYCRARNRIRRSISYVVFLFLAPAAANAIERYHVEPLPDDGFGSLARRLDHSGSTGVVGAIVEADGSSVATKWSWGEAQEWTANKLPTPAGFDSVANDMAFAPLKPAEVVVGIIGILVDSVWSDVRLAIWTREDGGDWTLHQIGPDRHGRLNGVSDGPFGNYHAVGAIQLPGGNWHAIIATELDAGFQMTDLGTLGGANSEAEDVIVDSEQNILVVGRAQYPDGSWRATLWREADRGEWHAHDMGALHDAQSQASAIRPHNDGLLAFGSSFLNNGRSRASIFFLDINGDSLVSPLDALLAYRNSSASDGIWFSGSPGGGNDSPHFRAVGTVWDDTDIVHVTSGAIFNGPFGVIPIANIIDERSWDVSTLHGIAPDGTIVGEGFTEPLPDDRYLSLVMTPTNEHMADAMHIRRGHLFRGSSVEDTWWDDGERLGIVAQKVGGQRLVDVEFEFATLLLPPGPLGLEIHVTASVVAKGRADASGEERILAYDHAQQKWKLVSTRPVGVQSTSTSVTLPWSEGDWNGDGRILVRVRVTSEVAHRRYGYALEKIMVTSLQ